MLPYEIIEALVYLNNQLLILDGEDPIGVTGGVSIEDEAPPLIIGSTTAPTFFDSNETEKIVQATKDLLAIYAFHQENTIDSSNKDKIKLLKVIDAVADIIEKTGNKGHLLSDIFNAAKKESSSDDAVAAKKIYQQYIKVSSIATAKQRSNFTINYLAKKVKIIKPVVKEIPFVEAAGVDLSAAASHEASAAKKKAGASKDSEELQEAAIQYAIALSLQEQAATPSGATPPKPEVLKELRKGKKKAFDATLKALSNEDVLIKAMRQSKTYKDSGDTEYTAQALRKDRSDVAEVAGASLDLVESILAYVEITIACQHGMDVKTFLTDSTFSFPVKTLSYLLQVYLLVSKYRCKDKSGKRLFKIEKIDLLQLFISSGSLAGTATSVASAVKGSSSLAGVGNAVSGGFGIASGIVTGFIDCEALRGQRQISKRFALPKSVSLYERLHEHDQTAHKSILNTQKTQTFMKDKIGNRMLDSSAGIVISAASIAGGVMQVLVISAVGVGMATGIGAIVITGAAAVGGTGLAIRKGFRKERKKSALKDNSVDMLAMLNALPGKTKLTEIPKFLKTENDVRRLVIAIKIYMGAISCSMVDDIDNYKNLYALYFGRILYGDGWDQKVISNGILPLIGRLKSF